MHPIVVVILNFEPIKELWYYCLGTINVCANISATPNRYMLRYFTD